MRGSGHRLRRRQSAHSRRRGPAIAAAAIAARMSVVGEPQVIRGGAQAAPQCVGGLCAARPLTRTPWLLSLDRGGAGM